MAVKIRLKRMGKIRAPFYRVVVMDSRTKRDGRAIEEIGKYHPTEEPSLIDIDTERAEYWLGQGAQPTEAVAALLKVTGDWQKYKGQPGTEGTLRVAEPKARRRTSTRPPSPPPARPATTARRHHPAQEGRQEGRGGARRRGPRRRGARRRGPPPRPPAARPPPPRSPRRRRHRLRAAAAEGTDADADKA